jgi:hypothetical protein
MNTSAIKKQLHNYLEIADTKKLKAIYAMVENDIAEAKINYTASEKAELDRRVNYYLTGGKMITTTELNKRLIAARKKRK